MKQGWWGHNYQGAGSFVRQHSAREAGGVRCKAWSLAGMGLSRFCMRSAHEMRVALPASKVKGLLATLNQASFAAVHELVGFGGLSCKH
jgi:hypothetical protein